MLPALRPPRTIRSVLLHAIRLIALLAWAGQSAIVVAPIVDARAVGNAAPHIESHGSSPHQAHSPDVCAACTAIALVGRPEPVRTLPPSLPLAPAAVLRAIAGPLYVARRSDAHPRAPPVRVSEFDATSWHHSDSLIPTGHASRIMAVRPPARGAGHRTRAAARYDRAT
jgi:hypothetical protein